MRIKCVSPGSEEEGEPEVERDRHKAPVKIKDVSSVSLRLHRSQRYIYGKLLVECHHN